MAVRSVDGAMLLQEQLVIKQTKSREIMKIEVPAEAVPAKLSLTFSTLALLFPLHFQYSLRPAWEDEEEDATAGSMEW